MTDERRALLGDREASKKTERGGGCWYHARSAKARYAE